MNEESQTIKLTENNTKPVMPAHDYAQQWARDTLSGKADGTPFEWGERNLAKSYLDLLPYKQAYESNKEELAYWIYQGAMFAEELAFWKHQAGYWFGYHVNLGNPPSEDDEKEAIDRLEDFRRKENAERYDVQPSHEIGS